jgi:ATP-dependent Clp protease ATP-binding subunit ClpA
MFDILSVEAIANIVQIQVGVVAKRLAEKGIVLEVSPDVYEYLAKEGYNPEYGARPLKRLIQNKILTPIANFIISNNVGEGSEILVTRKGEEFQFAQKKGKRVVSLKPTLTHAL